jgi:hypothetical protein
MHVIRNQRAYQFFRTITDQGLAGITDKNDLIMLIHLEDGV